MSASVYNNPYVYKPPAPIIKYPPVFRGITKKWSFKHILDSKFLSISAVLLFIAFIITLICIVSPFWFKLVFNEKEGRFGTEAVKRKLSINTGIIFINENEFDTLMDLNANNNQQVVPRLLALAQVLIVLGICSLVGCMAGTIILVLRRFGSPTTLFILAFFTTFTGICLILVFVFVLLMAMMSTCDPYDTGSDCVYTDNLEWRVLPIYSQYYRVEPLVHPQIKLNWTFYISLISGLLTLGGAALIWMEAFATYKKLCQVRYTQLHTGRDPHEGDINPVDHGKYVYKAPEVTAPGTYGMQPVMFQGGNYGYGMQEPTTPRSGVGFEPSAPRSGVGFEPMDTKRMQSSPPSSRRRSPPPKRRSPSPESHTPSPSPPPSRRRTSPPPARRQSPPRYGRRSPSPPPRRGPPSMNSSMSEGPYISREIDL